MKIYDQVIAPRHLAAEEQKNWVWTMQWIINHLEAFTIEPVPLSGQDRDYVVKGTFSFKQDVLGATHVQFLKDWIFMYMDPQTKEPGPITSPGRGALIYVAADDATLAQCKDQTGYYLPKRIATLSPALVNASASECKIEWRLQIQTMEQVQSIVEERSP
jgi:hypothetical protein